MPEGDVIVLSEDYKKDESPLHLGDVERGKTLTVFNTNLFRGNFVTSRVALNNLGLVYSSHASLCAARLQREQQQSRH